MMREENIPIALYQIVLVFVTVLTGLQTAVLSAVAVFLASYTVFLAYWYRQPIYDHVTPAGGLWPLIGCLSNLGLFYLFLRWWLWEPQELPILRSASFFGAAITVFFAYFAPAIFTGILNGLVIKYLRSKEPPSGMW